MDDYWQQEAIRRQGGDPGLEQQMQAELRAEQLQYYRNANTQQQPADIGGIQGIKEALTGVVVLVVIAALFKILLPLFG
ncbi:hypothetical protein ACFRNJ_11860 [Streptomyces sp. NPDC056721]|jgi:hypothetical protein|uniref:hypothetical protein n=1 Tax=Streptomyces sp. NPDC056721 TaxID=3345923 RepID=UPI0036BB4D06